MAADQRLFTARTVRAARTPQQRQPNDVRRDSLGPKKRKWRFVPECYGKYNTVYDRFAKWRDKGILETLFQALSQDADRETISIDSTSIKVHQSANGGQKKENRAVGRSRGGLNTKIHTLVDALGNPLRFLLSPGNDHDAVHAVNLLKGMDHSGSMVLGDKAYGTKNIRDYILSMDASYVIPPKAMRSNSGRQTMICIRNAIWSNASSRSSSGAGGSLRAMTSWTNRSWPLCTWAPSCCCSSDPSDNDISDSEHFLMFFLCCSYAA